MTAPRAHRWWSYAAALLAVALLTLAGVRALVMQVAEASPTPGMTLCGGGTAPADAAPTPARAPGKAHKACEFCSAAAHAPICGTAAATVAPLAVRYIAWRPRHTLGPRGPPAIIAKARGPPGALLTA